MKEQVYYKQLVDRYTSKKASDEELMVFFQLLREGALDKYLPDSFLEGTDIDSSADRPLPAAPHSRLYGIWTKIAVAASLTGIILFGIYLFSANNKSKSGKDTDQLTEASGNYTVVATPRGKQQNITLPDGTKIWLNAASSIRYSSEFNKTERTIELDGECYFEVAHNPSRPFHINTNNSVGITVIGTHFNVHAYKNEPVRTTLLEGALKVQSEEQSAILKPGQEALVNNAGDMPVVEDVDIEQSIAWKNGILQFNRANIKTVMNQLERWYDVEVIFEGKIPEKEFVGKIPDSSTIAEVLKILELSNIYCRIEGRKIIVLP